MSDPSSLGFENLSLRSYDFSLVQVPVLHWDNDRDKIMNLIKDNVSFNYCLNENKKLFKIMIILLIKAN